MSIAESQNSSNLSAQQLIDFEDEMAALFEAGQIPFPLHLAGGNESALIEIFRGIDKDIDWVLGGWRMHYHCLLMGVPPADLKDAIMKGRSIALAFPAYRILSSAIVGGIVPIALGIAAALKYERRAGTVWCFVGDMTASSGIFAECMRYAMGHDLPVQFIMEDNGMSVCTPTREVWGQNPPQSKFFGYAYNLTRPHVGIDKWISF